MHAAWETNSSSACGYRTTTSFTLLRYGGTTHTRKLLQWVDTSSSGKTGQEENGKVVAQKYVSPSVGKTTVWLRVKGEDSKGETVAGICYNTLDWGEELDETLFK